MGGNGLFISESYKFTASIFGYPSNLDNGEVMQACTGGAAKTRSVPHTSKIVGCNYGGGSSGGPWLWKYNGDTRLGYARGVTSLRTLEQPVHRVTALRRPRYGPWAWRPTTRDARVTDA